MRTISDTLQSAQQSTFVKALYKIVLTKGSTTYTYDKERILPSAHDEEPYSHRATIVLNNYDSALDDIDLKGFKGVISYGVLTSAGEEYSATAPVWVIDQEFDSDPNKLICTLELCGAFDLMADDQANQMYIPEDDDENTVKDLVDAVLGKTLDCYGHCNAFEVEWDEGYDALADTYKPKGGFRVYVGGNRLAAIRRLLDYTSNVARWEADGKVHILKPVTSGETYDYEYSLEAGHKFFSKAYRNTLVIPSRVYVISYEDDDPQYLGVASTSDYASLPAELKKISYIQAKLKDDGEADDIAEALIAKAEMWSKRGAAEVPLNVGAEVFDYVLVTDQRQGDARAGNLGYVHRRFGQDKWTMTFGFGNWLDTLKYRDLLNKLETYTDSGNYFPSLQVGQLYAYLDDIQDGPDLYIRQNYLHLDATGVFISESVLYAIRVPGEAKHNLWKQDSAPTDKDTGDFWLDTNYTPNKVMIWNGSSWAEATPAQLEQFGRATIYRELKSTSLTADGLVVLDEVQEGTYGLTLATSISAGKILLSKTEKDGLWYEESGVVLDATYGIALYGGEGINAFRTFATEEDYEAGTPVQVYIGTDGKLYAGAGAVVLDATGLKTYGAGVIQCYVGSDGAIYAGGGAIKLDSLYLTISGAALRFTDGDNILRGGIYAHADGLYIISTGDVDIVLDSSTDVIRPASNNTDSLGSPSHQFKGGYFKSRLTIPGGTDMYD